MLKNKCVCPKCGKIIKYYCIEYKIIGKLVTIALCDYFQHFPSLKFYLVVVFFSICSEWKKKLNIVNFGVFSLCFCVPLASCYGKMVNTIDLITATRNRGFQFELLMVVFCCCGGMVVVTPLKYLLQKFITAILMYNVFMHLYCKIIMEIGDRVY